MADVINGECKVMSFMDKLDAARSKDNDVDSIKNTLNYKLRFLNTCKNDAKNQCMNNILCNMYRNAVPLNDEYKTAYGPEICDYFKNFITTRCTPNGTAYYITDACSRSPFAKKICEAVDNLVNDAYRDKEINIDEIDPNELVFKTTDDVQKRLDVISNDLSSAEISQAIKDNVLQSASSEIQRAKEAKENLKNLENDLAKNPDMDNKAAVESVLDVYGYTEKKFFTPSLFEGIMIEKTREVQNEKEFPYNYGTMAMFKESKESNDMMDNAFIETVKEYTCLSLLKALKLESFRIKDVEKLAEAYAEGKI